MALLPDFFRLHDDVQHVSDRRPIGGRVIDSKALHAQHVANARRMRITLDILVQWLPFARLAGGQTLLVEVAFAHQQTLPVRNQRMVAWHGLRGHFEEGRFAGTAKACLRGGHTGKAQRITVIHDQLQAGHIAASQQVHADTTAQALRNGVVECGEIRIGAGHHRARHRADLHAAFPDAVRGAQVIAAIHHVQPVSAEVQLQRLVRSHEQRVDARALAVDRVVKLPMVLPEDGRAAGRCRARHSGGRGGRGGR